MKEANANNGTLATATVFVGKSKIRKAGKGLFSGSAFAEGERITKVEGEIGVQDDFERDGSWHDATHVLSLEHGGPPESRRVINCYNVRILAPLNVNVVVVPPAHFGGT